MTLLVGKVYNFSVLVSQLPGTFVCKKQQAVEVHMMEAVPCLASIVVVVHKGAATTIIVVVVGACMKREGGCCGLSGRWARHRRRSGCRHVRDY